MTLKGNITGKVTLSGESVTGGIAARSAVIENAAIYGDPECADPLPPEIAAGSMLACMRTDRIWRTQQSQTAANSGALGMILYNKEGLTGAFREQHHLPTIHLDEIASSRFLETLAGNTLLQVTASFAGAKALKAPPDVLRASSSRGGPGVQLGVMKPDLAAPGTDILAGQTGDTFPDDRDVQGELFSIRTGTSMASPHVAGAAALLRQLHPGWTPGQIQSALMTTASAKKLVREDGQTLAGPFDVGSGRLDIARLATPDVTFDATREEFLAHEADLWTVNYPSVYVPKMGSSLTVSRMIKSELSKRTKLKLKVVTPLDLTIIVPTEVVLDAGATSSFTISLDASAVPVGQVRHATLFIKGKSIARVPITIVRS